MATSSTEQVATMVEKMSEPDRLAFLSKITTKERSDIEEILKKRKGRESEGSGESDADKLLRLMRGDKPKDPPKTSWEDITEKDVEDIFSELQSETSITTYTDEPLSGFDFDGFDPGTVIKVVLAKGKEKGVAREEVLKDLSHMATIAHKKGSITDTNYKRLKPAGRTMYDQLSTRYGLKLGGAKGLPSDIITIGRIGPAMSGRIFLLLLADKIKPKRYTGSCQSSTLPDIFQSDATPSNLPAALTGVAQQYLLGLCEARSIDKSCAISPKTPKPKAKDVLSDQKQFVFTSYSSRYPSENDRMINFKKVSWDDVFDKTQTCAQAYKKINDEFVIPTKSDFSASIKSIQ